MTSLTSDHAAPMRPRPTSMSCVVPGGPASTRITPSVCGIRKHRVSMETGSGPNIPAGTCISVTIGSTAINGLWSIVKGVGDDSLRAASPPASGLGRGSCVRYRRGMSDESEKVRQHALAAADHGDGVYCWTGRVDVVPQVVQAVEGAGWRLEHFSTALSPSLVRLHATCLFRREM